MPPDFSNISNHIAKTDQNSIHSTLKGARRLKISRGYVKLDGLGGPLLLPEQNRTKIGRDMGRPIQLAQNMIFVRLWLT